MRWLVHGQCALQHSRIDDQLKLSSDGVFSIDEHAEQATCLPLNPTEHLPAACAYQSLRPPEIAKGIISPARRLVLGITLVEALTSNSPRSARARKIISQTRCPQFFSISRHCLHRDPQRAGPSWKLPASESRFRRSVGISREACVCASLPISTGSSRILSSPSSVCAAF